MTGRALDSPPEISRRLAQRVDQLVADLLPAGYRESHEWRCGSVAGEPGDSLGVHLTGSKAGIWSDFAAGTAGDALNLVRTVLGRGMGDALTWSRRWLGLEDGNAALPARPASVPASTELPPSPDRWRGPWQKARPIVGTLAEVYLAGRGLCFDDPAREVLRFIAQHSRRNPAGDLEHHPAMLALLRDVRTGEPCGIINVYLARDGSDRLRDKKGKTSWGRVRGAAVMLDPFEEPACGLTIAEASRPALRCGWPSSDPCGHAAGPATSQRSRCPAASSA